MKSLTAIFAALFLFALPERDVHAASNVPVVFQDDYVSIRSGVAETGSRPLHLGDPISFVLEVRFDPAQVRVQKLDAEFFRRAFAGSGNVQMYSQPIVAQTTDTDGSVQMLVTWKFQFLGCPDNITSCPGNKHYELPVVSIDYQIVAESGEVLNDKSARFRPWPGTIAATPSLAIENGQPIEFGVFFPGGAHAEPLPVNGNSGAGMVAMLAGFLLIVFGINRSSTGDRVRHHSGESVSTSNRWQLALGSLENDELPDDQWADLLRRCASWYCIDELGRNPHTPLATDFDRFFADVLHEEGISAENRSDFLARFLKLTGEDS